MLQEIVKIAKQTVPGIKTFSVEQGPDAVVQYIVEILPAFMDG